MIYSPYGTTTDASISHFGFAGEWTDKDTGNSYLRARWLDSSTGTFLSEDPLTQSTGQAFGYTAGNPLQQVDPLGLCNIWAGDIGNLGSDCYSFADTPAFQTITDSVAGFGDVASFGGSRAARDLFGTNNVVNTCSISYGIGGLAGMAAISAVTPSGITAVGKWSSKVGGFAKNIFSKFGKSDPSMDYINSLPKQGGSYRELDKLTTGNRAINEVEINHMPSAHHVGIKLKSKVPGTSARYNNAPAVIMTKADHAQTRTWGSKATEVSINDTKLGLTSKQVFEEDVKDIESLFGTKKYKKGIAQTRAYGDSINWTW